MTDRIHIRDLRTRCIIGANEDERHRKQDVLINITMHAQLKKACSSDRLEDSVDYRSVKLQVLEAVESSSFFLVERLAEEISRVCLTDARVEKVRVRVEKPGALRFARSAAVEIEREQGDG